MSTSLLMDVSLDQDTQSDFDLLQGAWVSVDGRRRAELLFAGRHYTLRFLDGDIYMGTFDLYPGRSPKVIDMHIAEGPARHQGKLAFCIYEVHGDELRWCPAEPGSDERLSDFPAVDHPRYVCTLFRRERPRRRG
jgi:uncharacterized protein (TIGR03067 family)